MQHNYPMSINEEWESIRFEKISPMDLSPVIEEGKVYVLDVRPQDFERDSTFIRGSTHCPLVHLQERYQILPTDRPIVITDWAMKQSPTAAKFLIRKGLTIYGILKGGMERWKAEGLPGEERPLEP